ncbi:MAG: c-type cytochrome [Akkermansiaceae bacterium]
MSDPSTNQPDLDDNVSVLADAAAVSREKQIPADGSEPISLWVILGSAVIVLIAGGVLFGGNLFDYKSLTNDSYTRALAPGAENAGPLPKPALEAYMRVGSKLAKASCLACHGSNGEGTADVPPLAGSEWVTGSSLKPAMIILNGMHQPITVAGKNYNGNMPSQGSGLKARELAGILNFVRNSFGNEAKFITMEMAQDALDTSKERNGGQVTAEELLADYDRELEGAEMDPATLVDPKTLEPVEAAQ